MNLVKIKYSDEGVKVESPKWHLSWDFDGTDRTFCGGEAYGFGESRARFEEKENGRVTCERCISLIKEIKSIKI